MINKLSQTVAVQYDSGFSPSAAADWKEAFAYVGKCGLTGVEIAVCYPDQIDVNDLMKTAKKCGVAITTISTGQICGRDQAFLTAEDPEKLKFAQDAIRGHIILSEKIGYPNVTIGLLRCGPGLEETQELEDRLSDSIYPLAKEAEKRGVKLQIEAINKSEASLFHSTASAVDYIRKLNLPSLGLLYDTFHSNLEDDNSIEAVHYAKGLITNVHMCDSNRGLPGDGTIDFHSIVKALLDDGYTGAFTLETKCVPNQEYVIKNYAEALKKAVSV